MNKPTRLNKNYRNKVLKQIGEQCRNRREIFGITATEMAEYLNVTVTYIYKFEKGMMDSLYLFTAYRFTELKDLSDGVKRKYGD